MILGGIFRVESPRCDVHWCARSVLVLFANEKPVYVWDVLVVKILVRGCNVT